MISDRSSSLVPPRARHASRPAPASGHSARRAFWRWSARVAGLVLAASALAFCLGYAGFVGQIARREPAAVPRTDAIVVVTGGAQRIEDGIGLLGADRGARLLISGVNEKTGREELAKLNPSARALLACCVDLDYRARNTIGNAIETRRWVRRHAFRSLLLVTSNYHMPRTLAELSHAMPELRIVPHPVVSDQIDIDGWWHDWSALRVLLPEYGKYLAARLRGALESDPEHSRLSIIIGGRKPVSPKPNAEIGPDAERRSQAPAERRGG